MEGLGHMVRNNEGSPMGKSSLPSGRSFNRALMITLSSIWTTLGVPL